MQLPRAKWLLASGVLVAAIGVGAVVVVSRGDDSRRVCTLIGSENGVGVTIPRTERHLRRVVACVGDRCGRLDPPQDHPPRDRVGFIAIPDREAGPRAVDVRLVIERAGRPAEVTTTSVRLQRFEPNGPGCGGTWWSAGVVYRNGELRAVQSRHD